MTFAELLVVVSAEGFASRNVAVPIQLTAPTSWVGAAFINAWAEGATPLEFYEAGTWGPEGASQLIERDGRLWHRM